MEKSRRTTKLSKKGLRRLLIGIGVGVVVLVALVLILRSVVSSRYGSDGDDDILSSTVSVGSISTTVSGTGTLTDEDLTELTVPYTVEIEEFQMAAGDSVTEGQLMATVDPATVVTALSAKQSEIDDIDSQIYDASDAAGDNRIYTYVSGRVKALYAAYGDDASTIMYDNGALCILSLDGYMAVDYPSDSAVAGDSVTVNTSDGTAYSGTISASAAGSATALISDNGPLNGDAVTVYGADGEKLGEGELYIHSPLNITAYAGTVASVLTYENAYVYGGNTLMVLADTSYTASYESLLKERGELEEDLEELVRIYKDGGVTAPFTGTVSSLTEGSDATTESAATDTVFSLCPDKTVTVSVSVDETDILSLAIGQEAVVTVDSVGDEEFMGTVTSIDRSGESSNGVTRYTAVITIDKSPAMLSGMSASVAINIQGVDNALLIPEDALQRTSSTYFVYTSYDSESGQFGGMKEVSAGISNGSFVEILSGLSEGDTVWYTKTETDMFAFSFGGGNQMGGGANQAGGNFQGGRPAGDFNGGSGGGMPSGMQGGRPAAMG